MAGEIIEQVGRYRVSLHHQEGADSPRVSGDPISNVVTAKNWRYDNVDSDGGPLQYGWDYFADRENGDELFIRWARMTHGAVVVEDRPHDGATAFWYLMPQALAEIGTVVDPVEFLNAEIREYRSWAEGDVWGIVIEKSVIWEPKEGQVTHGDGISSRLTTWEHAESCWGYIGRTYAEREAKEQFEIYRNEEEKNA